MDGRGFDEKTENGASENKQDEDDDSRKDILEEDDPEVEESKVARQTENKGSLWLRLKRDKLYRKKYMLTMAYFLSFLMLGWANGIIGPTFPDILLVAHTSLEKGSLFFTMGTLGYLIGSLIMGFVLDKRILGRNLLMFLLLVGLGVSAAVVPWCSLFEAMIFIHVMKGIFSGGLDTCGNAGLVVIWGSEGPGLFSTLHFLYSFGGILSPLVAAPFVMSSDNDAGNTFISKNSNMTFTNITNLNEVSVNMTNLTNDSRIEQISQIYIPYTITTCLCILTSLPFLVFSCISFQKTLDSKKTNSEVEIARQSKRRLRLTGFINMVFYIAMYVAVENTYAGFLTTFLVKELNWSGYQGSYITSGHWAAFATGRFLGIFLVRCVKPANLIFASSLTVLLSMLGFMMTSMYDVMIGVWIFSMLLGIAVSVIFPAVIIWTELRFIRVTGKIASIFVMAASVGFMVNPIFLGLLMDTFSPMWFCYLLFGETVLMMFLNFTGVCISRIISSRQLNIQAEHELVILNEKH